MILGAAVLSARNILIRGLYFCLLMCTSCLCVFLRHGKVLEDNYLHVFRITNMDYIRPSDWRNSKVH